MALGPEKNLATLFESIQLQFGIGEEGSESVLAMAGAGQTLNDRILAAKHSIAGQGLAKAVCKATTEELIGPKRKHLECKFRFK